MIYHYNFTFKGFLYNNELNATIRLKPMDYYYNEKNKNIFIENKKDI